MQSQAEIERTCYANELAEAERHMEPPHERGGICGTCANCLPNCFDMVDDEALRDELVACYGICQCPGEDPMVVPLRAWHEWDECWTKGDW